MNEREPGPMPTVGVIGVGMVGQALVDTFCQHDTVLSYDRKHGYRHHYPEFDCKYEIEAFGGDPYQILARDCDLLFLCVPTPMHPDGRQDLSILESVLDALSPWVTGCLIVIKSTVLPGTTDRLQNEHPHCQIVFNPEFLREATATEDFRTQDRVIVGTAGQPAEALAALYAVTHPTATYYETDALTAELVKYTANCFLATKVSFANEIAQIAAAMGVDYAELLRLLVTDPRIGTSHLQVPGPDGHKGFGMTCFPKDINALIDCAHAHGVRPTVLEAVWQKNLEVRPEKDWEQMIGRAVSEPKSAPSSGLAGP